MLRDRSLPALTTADAVYAVAAVVATTASGNFILAIIAEGTGLAEAA